MLGLMQRWLPVTVLIAGAGSVASADVLSFQDGVDGYAGTADSYIQAASPNTTFDTFNFFVNGVSASSNGEFSQGLLRFDDIFGAGPNQIPLGSIINSATLTLTKLGGFGNVRAFELAIPFSESTSTWNSLDNGISYPIPPTDDPTGTDVLGLSDSRDFGSALDVSPNVRLYNVTATLANWSAGNTNNGWALVMSESNPGASASIGASNSGTLANRPVLTVDFTIPEPASLAFLGVGTALLLRRRTQG